MRSFLSSSHIDWLENRYRYYLVITVIGQIWSTEWILKLHCCAVEAMKIACKSSRFRFVHTYSYMHCRTHASVNYIHRTSLNVYFSTTSEWKYSFYITTANMWKSLPDLCLRLDFRERLPVYSLLGYDCDDVRVWTRSVRLSVCKSLNFIAICAIH